MFKRYKLKYKFSNFQVPVYTGKLAAPNFKTDKEAYSFRTQIRDQCKEQGINFAGHFTVAMWGCGSPCQQIAIIDRVNGAIYYSHIPEINNKLGFGLKYKKTSRMVVLNSDLLDEHKGYIFCFSHTDVEQIEWTKQKLHRLP